MGDVGLVKVRLGILESRLVLVRIGRHEALDGDQDGFQPISAGRTARTSSPRRARCCERGQRVSGSTREPTQGSTWSCVSTCSVCSLARLEHSQAHLAVGVDVGVEAAAAAIGRGGGDGGSLAGVVWSTSAWPAPCPHACRRPLPNFRENWRCTSAGNRRCGPDPPRRSQTRRGCRAGRR